MLNFTSIYFQDGWANMAAHSIAQSVAGLTGKIIRRRLKYSDRVLEPCKRRLQKHWHYPGQIYIFSILDIIGISRSGDASVSVSLLFLLLSVNGLDTGPLVATC